jgi:hypothetical protein
MVTWTVTIVRTESAVLTIKANEGEVMPAVRKYMEEHEDEVTWDVDMWSVDEIEETTDQ